MGLVWLKMRAGEFFPKIKMKYHEQRKNAAENYWVTAAHAGIGVPVSA